MAYKLLTRTMEVCPVCGNKRCPAPAATSRTSPAVGAPPPPPETTRQAAAVARLSSFVDSYTTMRGPDPEYVHSIHAGPDGGRSDHIRISDLRTLLAMVAPTPGAPEQ